MLARIYSRNGLIADGCHTEWLPLGPLTLLQKALGTPWMRLKHKIQRGNPQFGADVLKKSRWYEYL